MDEARITYPLSVEILQAGLEAERQAHAATKAELAKERARLDALETVLHMTFQGDGGGGGEWEIGADEDLWADTLRDAADQLIARQEAKDAKD